MNHGNTVSGSSPVTSRFAAFEGQFGYTLPAALAPKRRAASAELAEFRAQMQALAGLSTLGTVSLSGVSLRNDGLEKLAITIGAMESGDDQATAIDELLTESDRLPHDQNAHVIAKVVQDLLLQGRSGLDPHACPRIGRRIFQAGLKVAPNLLPESVEADSLSLWLNRLVDCPVFEFTRNSHEILAESGLPDPNDERTRVLRRNVLKRIATELDRITAVRLNPADLDTLLARIAQHPEVLRSRLLAMVIGICGRMLRQPNCAMFVEDILQMIEELPVTLRASPLEAFCNQIHTLPIPLARMLLAGTGRAIERLDDTHDFRFNRTRRELVERLHRQQMLMAAGGFLPSDSLAEFEQRTANVD